jgi:hypothetical protein
MKTKLTIVLVLLLNVAFGESIKDKLIGEWAITAGGTVTSVLQFKEDGTVLNKTADGIGSYRILEDDRLMIEFPDGILLGSLKFTDGRIFLTGSFSASQPLSISLSEVTEEREREAKESMQKTQSQLDEYMKSMEKVRKTSQMYAIKNNLRQLASAAQQYMLETGESKVHYKDLVGKDKYIRELEAVNGESYQEMTITMRDTEISVVDADGELHKYNF